MRYLKAAIIIGTLSALIVKCSLCNGMGFHDSRYRSAREDLPTVEAIYHSQRRPVARYRAAGLRGGVDDSGHHPADPQGRCSRRRHFSSVHWFLDLCASQRLYSPFPGALAILSSYLTGMAYGRYRQWLAQEVSRASLRPTSVAQRPQSLGELGNSDEFPGMLQEGTVIVCEVQNQRELMSCFLLLSITPR